MVKVLLSGANGKMGQKIAEMLKDDPDMTIVAGIDRTKDKKANYFPVFPAFSDINITPDVIIDFSHPSYLDSLLKYIKENHIPAVIGTTGYDSIQLNLIKEAGLYAPVLYSANMSFGVNLIKQILKQYGAVLSRNCDIEIVEKHHREKQDAPSGTARLFADTINQAGDNSYQTVNGHNKKRETKEIGIHSVRGGTIVGEHEIIFAGIDEIIEFRHTAMSKDIFASGAVKAAKFIDGKANGYYTMDDFFKKED